MKKPSFLVKSLFFALLLGLGAAGLFYAQVQQINLLSDEPARSGADGASARPKSTIPANRNVTFWSDYPADELSRVITDQMTDSELLSQTFMFGWAGAEPPLLLHQWVERGLGSIKVFGWNTDDIHTVAKSVATMQHKSAEGRFQIPLFVATDQEGGWVRHVKGDTTIAPGNMAIGASGYPIDSWYSAYYICREIKILGINMNFAPTVDLYTNHDSTIIGTRAFGDDPDKAGVLGSLFVAGSKAAGVIPTVKHFPGHGDTSLDSHGKLPVINVDFETFKSRELIPYLYLLKEGCPALMSGHLSFPQIETSGAPASLSKYFLTELLRNQLNYKGLVITDDMAMVGATSYAGSLSVAFRMALEAGNDIILSSSTPLLNEALWTRNLDLMATDDDFRDRVKDAARRVIMAKLEYFKGENPAPLYPNPDVIDDYVPDREGMKFFLEQACRSITVEKQGTIPLTKENSGRILLCGSLPSFFEDAKKRWPDASYFRFDYDLGPNGTQWVLDNLPPLAAGYDTLIICVSSENHAKIAEYFRNSGKRVIIFSTMSPVLGERLAWADTVLLGYSWRCEYSLSAMVAVLAGEYEPIGVKPYGGRN